MDGVVKINAETAPGAEKRIMRMKEVGKNQDVLSAKKEIAKPKRTRYVGIMGCDSEQISQKLKE